MSMIAFINPKNDSLSFCAYGGTITYDVTLAHNYYMYHHIKRNVDRASYWGNEAFLFEWDDVVDPVIRRYINEKCPDGYLPSAVLPDYVLDQAHEQVRKEIKRQRKEGKISIDSLLESV